MIYNINFLAYAYDKGKSDTYASFLIPFTFFALLTNNNSHVEIIVNNINGFKKKYRNEIKILEEINNNFLIREPQFKPNRNIPNTYRFFEKPTIDSEYTYISDIDIMFLEDNIIPKYESFWPLNLPYNNILRVKNSVRLTGVHMVKTKKYYTKKLVMCQAKHYNLNKSGNDEIILGAMCREVFGLPNFKHRMRPIYGIHFSPNRGNNKRMALVTNKNYYEKYMDFKNKYKDLFDFDIFKKLTNQLLNQFIIKSP